LSALIHPGEGIVNDIKQTVRRYIVEHLSSADEAKGIADDTDLKESGILESLSTLKLVSFLEKTFNIEIQADDIDAGDLSSLARIETLVKARTNMKS
jgi:acyl carrier protein